MNIAREIKKVEAIERLKTIGIIADAIDQFIDDDVVMVSENPFGFLYHLNDEQKKLVADFEREYDALVYHANLCNTEFGELLSLFYVNDYEEEWEMENNDIKYGYSCVYCINNGCPEYSEFGTIAFKPVNGGVKRIG